MPNPRPSQHQRGFTLIELLVVITVIAILASMVMPAIGFIRELANRTRCARNQNGIFAALIAYQEGNDAGWPNARCKIGSDPTKPGNQAIPAGETCAQYTAGVFEILAASMRDSLPVSIFRCPSNIAPNYRPNPNLQPSLTRADTTWGWGEYRIPYAMDWSAPADAGAVRVLLADRDVMNHRESKAVVCYADGHTGTLNRQRNNSGGRGWLAAQGPEFTMGLTGPLSDVVVENRESTGSIDGGEEDITPDNIYDNSGDFPTARGADRTRIPGAGDARRACVR